MVELCIRLSDPQWVGSLIDFNGVYHCLFVRQVQVKQKCISMSGWKVHWQVPSKYKIFGQFLFFILTNDSSCRFRSISCPVWGLRVSSNREDNLVSIVHYSNEEREDDDDQILNVNWFLTFDLRVFAVLPVVVVVMAIYLSVLIGAPYRQRISLS